jgi:molybdate transport system substrate-binding protein
LNVPRGVLAIAFCVACSDAKAAELKLMVSGAMAEPVREIAQDVAQHNGDTLDIIVGTTQSQEKRIRAGEKPDLIEVNADSMQVLEQDRRILAGTRTKLARANIAVAVPNGALAPPLATPDDLKRALLSARRIALTDPKIKSQATEAIQNLLRRLGVQQQLLAKVVPGSTGLDAVQKMARGEADLAISFESEIRPITGAKFVGRVPASLQDPTSFEGAVGAASAHPDAAKALLREIASPRGREILKRAGLEPLANN